MRIPLTAAITLCLLVLLGCPQTPPAAVSEGGSGAFGIVTVNGKQKLYLPLDGTQLTGAGNAQIAVVDVGLAGSGVSGVPAQITLIDLGSGDFATTTAGDSSVIVAASSQFTDVWLIDPNTDKVTKTFQLDSSYGQSNFSGGTAYVAGVAVDSANHRAFLAVWNGFAVLDTNSGSITGSYALAPPENFGFDAVAQRLYAPFYACSAAQSPTGDPPPFCSDYTTTTGDVITDGLNVVDLASGNIFTYEDDSATDPTMPLGSEPDSASADSSTHVAAIPNENSGFTGVLDMAHAVFDTANKRFTAPHHTVTTATDMDGVAIESTRHLSLLETEFESSVGLFDANAANAGTDALVTATLPDLPDGSGFSNGGDPHGVAVTTAITNGTSVGFVYDSNTFWVARVDLVKMQQLASGGVVSDLSSAVTYLNPLQHP